MWFCWNVVDVNTRCVKRWTFSASEDISIIIEFFTRCKKKKTSIAFFKIIIAVSRWNAESWKITFNNVRSELEKTQILFTFQYREKEFFSVFTFILVDTIFNHLKSQGRAHKDLKKIFHNILNNSVNIKKRFSSLYVSKTFICVLHIFYHLVHSRTMQWSWFIKYMRNSHSPGFF